MASVSATAYGAINSIDALQNGQKLCANEDGAVDIKDSKRDKTKTEPDLSKMKESLKNRQGNR